MAKNMYTKIWMFFLRLREVEQKKYSANYYNYNEVYFFDNMDDFYQYFTDNQINPFMNMELVHLAILFIQKDGTVIAYKSLCDHIITNIYKDKSLNKYLSKSLFTN